MNTMKEYFNTIILPLSNLINKKKNDTKKFKIQLSIAINFISVDGTEQIFAYYVHSDTKNIKRNRDTNRIVIKLIKPTKGNYHEIITNITNYAFHSILLLSIHIRKKINNQ